MIGYDTIYAHQDREDDALIGIKSTALLFGERTKPMLARVLRARRGADRARGLERRRPASIFALGLAGLRGASRLADRDASTSTIPAICLAVFKSNRDAGLILFAALALQAAFAGAL